MVDGDWQRSCVSFVEETVSLGSPTQSDRCYFEVPVEVVMLTANGFGIVQDWRRSAEVGIR